MNLKSYVRIVIQNFGDIEANNLSIIFKLTSEVIKAHDDSVEPLVKALERLRDCDWTISLPDRMDAVRDIAKKALEAYK